MALHCFNWNWMAIMKNQQIMEIISSVMDKIYAGMDHVDDIETDSKHKDEAEIHFLSASMQLDDLFSKLEDEVYVSGERSGAV